MDGGSFAVLPWRVVRRLVVGIVLATRRFARLDRQARAWGVADTQAELDSIYPIPFARFHLPGG
jgi:hypothetical protein